MNEINITSAHYIRNEENTKNLMINAIINDVSTGVPLDPANSHYAEIMRQVEAGTLVIADAE